MRWDWKLQKCKYCGWVSTNTTDTHECSEKYVISILTAENEKLKAENEKLKAWNVTLVKNVEESNSYIQKQNRELTELKEFYDTHVSDRLLKNEGIQEKLLQFFKSDLDTIMKLVKEISELKKENAELKKDLDKSDKGYMALKAELRDRDSNILELEDAAGSWMQDCDRLTEEIEKLKERIEKLRAALVQADCDISKSDMRAGLRITHVLSKDDEIERGK